jgi:hypothetical protein
MLRLLFITVFISASLWGEERITLYLLDTESPQSKNSRFWIDWKNEWMGVKEKKEIQGKAAEEIIALLTVALLPEEADHLCGHSPVYGIEAIRADGIKVKTSLCFDCLTWVRPNKRLWISGERGVENKLCVELQKYIKLPTNARRKSKK